MINKEKIYSLVERTKQSKLVKTLFTDIEDTEIFKDIKTDLFWYGTIIFGIIVPLSLCMLCQKTVDFIAQEFSRPYKRAVMRYGDINGDNKISDFEGRNFDYGFQCYMAGRYYRGRGYDYTSLLNSRGVNKEKFKKYLNDFGRSYKKGNLIRH